MIHGPVHFGWPLVSVICSGRVLSDTGNKQGADHVGLECEANKSGLYPGVAGNQGGVLSRRKTWSLLTEIGVLPSGPDQNQICSVTLVLKSQIPPLSTLSEVDPKSKNL